MLDSKEKRDEMKDFIVIFDKSSEYKLETVYSSAYALFALAPNDLEKHDLANKP